MSNKHIVVGRIGKPYGVQGWLKVNSFTQPKENILEYQPWLICNHGTWQNFEILAGRKQANTIVVQVADCESPEAATRYTGIEIAVLRTQLPALSKNEYYWSDLEGLTVATTEGVELGQVDYLFSSGANDVVVVKGVKERLIPFIHGTFIKNVDLSNKLITVDWDPEF